MNDTDQCQMSIRIAKGIKRDLKMTAAQHGISLAALLRHAVELVLQEAARQPNEDTHGES